MANYDSRPFAPGVHVTEYWHSNEYFGTAEALVAAGLARLNQFPGQPGMGKTCVTFYDGERVVPGRKNKRDEKYLGIRAEGKNFRLRQGISKEVEAERSASFFAEQKAEQKAEREAEEVTASNKMIADITLRLLPKTPDEYRQKLVKDWDHHASIMRDCTLPKKGTGADVYSMAANGFRLEESDIERFDDLVDEIRTLLMNAGVLFNAKRQKEIISNCNAAIAKGDTKFQRVLASCIE